MKSNFASVWKKFLANFNFGEIQEFGDADFLAKETWVGNICPEVTKKVIEL